MIGIALGGVGVLASMGLADGTARWLGAISVLSLALTAGLVALAYLLGAETGRCRR